MPNTKPFVQIAAVCEKVLQEKDGVISAIRMVDTYFVEELGPQLPAEIKPGLQLQAVICLKSGDVTGEHQIEIKVRKPDGEVKDVGKYPVVFKGAEHGVNMIMNFLVSIREPGLMWFDVFYEGELLTSIPVKLVQQPPREQPPASH